jgi:hypothetical protein
LARSMMMLLLLFPAAYGVFLRLQVTDFGAYLLLLFHFRRSFLVCSTPPRVVFAHTSSA